MFDSMKFNLMKRNIFRSITIGLIILLIILFYTTVSNFSLHRDHLIIVHKTAQAPLKITSMHDHPQSSSLSESNLKRLIETGLFNTSSSTTTFDTRVRKFFGPKKCKVQVFMTWISPASTFGEREFLGLESLFKTNRRSCLIILSTTMDSKKGDKILKPLTSRGFRVRAITPDLWASFNNTPAENWLNDIKNGKTNPGNIPLEQNLSNLLRLAVLYKYGGVYLDTDFIILKDFSSLRNTIGAQSIDYNGKWTRLNNAVLIFDKNHPLIYKFIEEFAISFDGNKWGHNGPYLVSRVIDRVSKTGEFNFTIMPPMAFYPAAWTQIPGYFSRPKNQVDAEWAEAKIRHLRRVTYGLHLWNRETREFKIEEGSIIARLISEHCVMCRTSSYIG